MSNEDYVKQGRSNKLLGRYGGIKPGIKRRGKRWKSFLRSTIIGAMLALADGCTRLSLREVASGLGEGSTRRRVAKS